MLDMALNLFPHSFSQLKNESWHLVKVGVVIGRFQCDGPHQGHRDVIQQALKENEQVLVFIGSIGKPPSHENPLPYETRRRIIQAIFPTVTVLGLPDARDNQQWSERLDQILGVMFLHWQVTLYTGRDGFNKHYTTKKYPVVEVENVFKRSATEIRSQIGKDFNQAHLHPASVIWATQNQYPKVYPTVDIALFDEAGWLYLGRKPGEQQWRFPGGFVDVKDSSFALAAIRELKEECGDIEVSIPHYLGSISVDDYRYRNEKDKIITTFFYCRKLWGRIQAGDDLGQLQGFAFPGCRDSVIAEHVPLYDLLENHYKCGTIPRWPRLDRKDA